MKHRPQLSTWLTKENGIRGQYVLDFGQYRGTLVRDLPLAYARWLRRQEWIEDRLREALAWRIGQEEYMKDVTPVRGN